MAKASKWWVFKDGKVKTVSSVEMPPNVILIPVEKDMLEAWLKYYEAHPPAKGTKYAEVFKRCKKLKKQYERERDKHGKHTSK
jgi:hypothetical protein